MWKNRVASCLNRKYNTITTRHYSYRKSTNQKHKGQHDFILVHPSSSHDDLQAKKKMIQAELNTLTVLLLYRLLVCVVNTPTLHKCQGTDTTTGINIHVLLIRHHYHMIRHTVYYTWLVGTPGGNGSLT